ncbi:spindle pole body component 98 [Tieghemostelium lacteum]|uniref:Spindle pole body component 98 n=1 Tax=Tieghemostelium lacteum TaxID=361077 RepID=A0A152A556_TIELA|nr:spindle pole body component 98 [Tieghemostelium lacteum]|eukprot:KYR01195.1 spindle pole body component 98 [Tieghemostelium lacteum]
MNFVNKPILNTEDPIVLKKRNELVTDLTPAITNFISPDDFASNNLNIKFKDQLNFNSNNLINIEEDLLVKDIIYVFQGIDGTYIKFDYKLDSYVIDKKLSITKPKRDLIGRLGEFGWLFKKVIKFVNNSDFKNKGLTNQSFCSSINDELVEFYRLITILESQINRNLLMIHNNNNNINNRITDKEYQIENLTLKRMFVWIQEPLKKLKVIVSLIDSVGYQMKGGEILSVIEMQSKHGDQVICDLVKTIQIKTSQPVFAMIKTWIFEGILQDPFKEFFIQQNHSLPNERIWKERFVLAPKLIPCFLSLIISKRILVIGKSINYMKEFFSGKDYNIPPEYYRSNSGVSIDYEHLSELDLIIDQVSKLSSERLLKIVLEKFKFIDHLKALKRYLLLGQGDFIQYLMDLVGEDLLKPVKEVMRHKLLNSLETAIRNSNVQFDDPDLKNRLDISLLEAKEKSIGWDIFSLDYHVDAPLNTILRSTDIVKYKKIFHFMWGIKRVEFSLNSIWRKFRASGESLRSLSLYLADFHQDIHRSHLLMNEMILFLRNLQYYIMFEVLECSWKQLVKEIQEAQDLDQLIDSHIQYLHDISSKTFLSNSESTYEAFKILQSKIIKFTNLQYNLFKLTIAIQNNQKKVSQSTQMIAQELQTYRNHLNNTHQEYTKQLNIFQSEISLLKFNQDLNPISLTYMLDFNEFYKNNKSSNII